MAWNRYNLQIALAITYFLILYFPSMVNESYGIFIDEFYYIACSKRLDWGYVDQPPLSLYILSLLSPYYEYKSILRLIPSLLGGIGILIVGQIVHSLGGKNKDIIIACLAMMTAPVFQILFGFYSMNSFEICFILLLIYLSLLFKNTNQFQYWIPIGIVIALAFMNKHTSLILSLVLVIPIVIENKRKVIRSRFFYASIVVSLIIASFHIYWQIQNDFISLEFYKLAILHKNIPTSFQKAFVDQVLSQNPATFLLWSAGFYYLWMEKKYRNYFFSCLIILVVFLFSGSSRPDRIAAIYPFLFATGVLAINNFWKNISLILIVLVGFILAPLTIPVLAPKTLARYSSYLGVVPEIEERKKSSIPQWFADRRGWEEFARDTSIAIDSLNQEDRNELVIFTEYYGQAGALAFYNIKYPIISGHNQYYLWGKPDSINYMIVFNEKRKDFFLGYFEEAKCIGSYSLQNTIDKECIYLLSKPKENKKDYWQYVKKFR